MVHHDGDGVRPHDPAPIHCRGQGKAAGRGPEGGSGLMKAHKDLSNNYRRLTGSVPKSNGGPETPIGLPLIARQTLIWLGKHQDLWGVGTRSRNRPKESSWLR